MSKRSIRLVYLYIVCLITLMMTIAGVISTVNAIARLCLPVVHMPYSRVMDLEFNAEITDTTLAERASLIESEEQRIAEEKLIHAENERIRSLRSVINSLIVWLIALPVFIVHRKMIISEEKQHVHCTIDD